MFGYWIGSIIHQRTRLTICNPMLICIIIVICFLKAGNIPYDTYKSSTSLISFLLLPGTVCLAIPLYEQWEALKHNVIPVLSGIIVGTVTSLGSVVLLSNLLHLDRVYAVTLLPKSVTAAIGANIAESLGGYAALSSAIIIMTGMVGHLIANWVFKLFHIKNPIAKGVALGTTSHALGTAKALEIGAIEGAMSGLAIGVAGIITSVLAPLASLFLIT